MRPLPDKTKAWLYDKVALGPASRFARPAYDRLIEGLVRAHRVFDAIQPRDTGDVSRVTAVIKTFERPYAVRRLVDSVQRVYPSLEIVVVDDSRVPVHLDGVRVIEMPFDSGLSAGRNRALEEVETPYFFLLDDDFLLSSMQRLSEWVAWMDRHLEVDILGGRTIDLPLYSTHEPWPAELFSGLGQPKMALGKKIEGCEVVDKVQNFFVARTDAVKRVGWNERLKTAEHNEFFVRARGQLVTVYNPKMFVHHVKYPFDVKYLTYRWRSPDQY